MVSHDRLGLRQSVRSITVSGDKAGLAALADDYRKALVPAASQQVEEWLAELSVIVAGGAQDEFTVRLKVKAYLKRLADYPADVVREALTVVRWKYWPSWDELADVCDRLSGMRRAVLRRIEEAASAEPEPERDISPEAMEQRRKAAEEIMAGFVQGRGVTRSQEAAE